MAYLTLEHFLSDELDPVRRLKNAVQQRRELIPRKWKRL
jgi:hypothetical protein